MKKSLLNQLKWIKMMYLFGMLATAQNNALDSSKYPSKVHLYYSTIEKEQKKFLFDLEELRQVMVNQRSKKILLDQFPILCLRSFLKESYETIKVYVNETGQFDKFQSQSWYPFVRIIRNSLSHDFKFKFDEKTRKILPITWTDFSITEDLEGKLVPLRVFNFLSAILLFEEMYEFVRQELS